MRMRTERSRITLLAGAAALLATTGRPSSAGPERLPDITVYKSPT
jgi:hypothetical protein